MESSFFKYPAIAGMIFFISVRLPGQTDLSEPYEKRINERQPPDVVLEIAGIKSGMTVGEIGAGRGRYTVYIASKVGEAGKVLANDIDESSLAFLRGRCMRFNIKNVETILGEANDPQFPSNSLDISIMVLVYHMIENPDRLLINLKKSLKPGSRLVIVDPRDEEIDEEFGIDRSAGETKIPTIRERVQRSAKNAGYELALIDTTLAHDFIFILKPILPVRKKSAADLIHEAMLREGREPAMRYFESIKKDTLQYDLSEERFAIHGYEFIGAGSYPEALEFLQMGIELNPKSSKLYGEIGEIYLITGKKEKARTYYKLYLENGPDSLKAKTIMENFDAMYDQMQNK